MCLDQPCKIQRVIGLTLIQYVCLCLSAFVKNVSGQIEVFSRICLGFNWVLQGF